LAQRKKVLVHCEYGIGRGPTLACCVLISTGVPPLPAML
jgi:protein-tyrosine phosphatase